MIGVNSFELPGEPSGVDRESIGQLPSGFCVATRKSIPRLISGRSAVKPTSDKTYKVWPVAKAAGFKNGPFQVTVSGVPQGANCVRSYLLACLYVEIQSVTLGPECYPAL